MPHRLLAAAYRLRYHYFADWPLDRWIVTLAWGAALLLLLAGRRAMPSWGWPAFALLFLSGLAVVVLRRWAAARMYVSFTPQPDLPAPAGHPADPSDKIQLHSTGHYEVEGKSHFFAGLLAYWRTFATREHAVMAIVHRSRYLLVGNMPDRDLGMWYIFFRPEDIVRVSAGWLRFGTAGQPGLAVTYLGPVPPAPSGLRKLLRRPPPARRTTDVYLIFDDEEARLRVWADLLADAPAGVAP